MPEAVSHRLFPSKFGPNPSHFPHKALLSGRNDNPCADACAATWEPSISNPSLLLSFCSNPAAIQDALSCLTICPPQEAADAAAALNSACSVANDLPIDIVQRSDDNPCADRCAATWEPLINTPARLLSFCQDAPAKQAALSCLVTCPPKEAADATVALNSACDVANDLPIDIGQQPKSIRADDVRVDLQDGVRVNVPDENIDVNVDPNNLNVDVPNENVNVDVDPDNVDVRQNDNDDDNDRFSYTNGPAAASRVSDDPAARTTDGPDWRNGPFGNGWGPWSDAPWTTGGSWQQWWDGRIGDCPGDDWEGWTRGPWIDRPDWTSWTACAATTRTAVVTTTVSGAVRTVTSLDVDVAQATRELNSGGGQDFDDGDGESGASSLRAMSSDGILAMMIVGGLFVGFIGVIAVL